MNNEINYKQKTKRFLNDTELLDCIKMDKIEKSDNYIYEKMFNGELDIDFKKPSKLGGPNNKISTNFFKTVINTKLSYINGNKIDVNLECKNSDKILREINSILELNNFELERIKITKDLILKKESYIVVFQDSKGRTKFEVKDANEGIRVMKNKTDVDYYIFYYEGERISIDDRNKNKELITFVEIVDDRSISFWYFENDKLLPDYTRTNDGTNEQFHIFNEVPVVYMNMKDISMTDLKTLKDNNDAYNYITSLINDNIEELSINKMKLKGGKISPPVAASDDMLSKYEEAKIKFKKAEIYQLTSDGDVEYFGPKVDLSGMLKVKTDLRRDIFRMSGLIDPMDENNNNLSGKALIEQNKNLEQEIKLVIKVINNGLLQLMDIIKPIIEIKTKSSYSINELNFNIEPLFPSNSLEDSELKNKENKSILECYKSGLISMKTAIQKLGFVDDPIEEMRRINNEGFEDLDNLDLRDNQHIHGEYNEI